MRKFDVVPERVLSGLDHSEHPLWSTSLEVPGGGERPKPAQAFLHSGDLDTGGLIGVDVVRTLMAALPPT
jgi:hypothetical protein